MEEDNKFWKRIIRKYLQNQDFYGVDFTKDWKGLMDLKQTKPEMLRELGRAVQDYLNRHEGEDSKGKCFEASFGYIPTGRKEWCSHRRYTISPLHVVAEAGNTLLYKFILERSEDKNPIVDEWRFDFELDVEWTPLLAAARYGQLDTCLAIMDDLGVINPGNTEGLTPLHAAAPGGHFQICNAILEQLGNPSSYIFEPRGQLQSHATSMCGRERSRRNI